METLHGFPNVSSIASQKLVFSPPTYSLKAFCCRHRRRVYVSSSCHASSSENSGDTNNGKSNEDLRNEIREFLSSAALPENHVPSLRELLQHNRRDLACVVRRTGYKHIRQLLETSATTNSNALHTHTDNTGSEGQVEIPTVQETKYLSKELYLNGKSSYAFGTLNLYFGGDVADFFDEVDMREGKFLTSNNSILLPYILFSDGTLEIKPVAEGGQESESDDAHKERTGNDEDLQEEKTENKVDIQHMEQELHQKEWELKELKRYIAEKELALASLETEAETKSNHIHALLSESDTDLKRVEIQYQGDASIVELAGSFNGWQNRIIMKMVPSSQATSPTQSRTSQLWSAVLHLYPGIYEIKFVVDGRWNLHPKMEKVLREFTYNNILRVD